MPNPLSADWTAPSSKVVTSVITSILLYVLFAVADDSTILEPLPDHAEGIISAAIIGIAGYLRRERRPSTPAAFGQ